MLATRPTRPILHFMDKFCDLYKDMFSDMRSFEAFKYLHLDMISDIKRKSLPTVAKVRGLDNQQSLHSPWQAQQVRQQRLETILKCHSLILLIDETSDCKKSNRTDYVKRQYIGNVSKKENGIVTLTRLVTAIIAALTFEVYKLRKRLKEHEACESNPLIIQTLICFNWLKQWLVVFPMLALQFSFAQLIRQMNAFICPCVH